MTKKIKQEQGRSMVEMLGVLAIIGVLSVAGIAGYKSAITKHRANETIDRLLKRAVVIAGQVGLGQQADISGFNPQDGTYTIPNGITTPQGQFVITVEDVPEEVCQKIKDMWTLPTIIPSDSCSGTNNMTFTFANDLSGGGSAPEESNNTCTPAEFGSYKCDAYGEDGTSRYVCVGTEGAQSGVWKATGSQSMCSSDTMGECEHVGATKCKDGQVYACVLNNDATDNDGNYISKSHWEVVYASGYGSCDENEMTPCDAFGASKCQYSEDADDYLLYSCVDDHAYSANNGFDYIEKGIWTPIGYCLQEQETTCAEDPYDGWVCKSEGCDYETVGNHRCEYDERRGDYYHYLCVGDGDYYKTYMWQNIGSCEEFQASPCSDIGATQCKETSWGNEYRYTCIKQQGTEEGYWMGSEYGCSEDEETASCSEEGQRKCEDNYVHICSNGIWRMSDTYCEPTNGRWCSGEKCTENGIAVCVPNYPLDDFYIYSFEGYCEPEYCISGKRRCRNDYSEVCINGGWYGTDNYCLDGETCSRDGEYKCVDYGGGYTDLYVCDHGVYMVTVDLENSCIAEECTPGTEKCIPNDWGEGGWMAVCTNDGFYIYEDQECTPEAEE